MENTDSITAELIKDPALSSMMDMLNQNNTGDDYKDQYLAITDEFKKLKSAFIKLKAINEQILSLYEDLKDDHEDLLEELDDIQNANINNQSIQ